MNLAAATRAKAPYFHLLTPPGPPPDVMRTWEKSMPGLVARIVRGEKSTRKAELMNEIGAALQLSQFGENWDALNDVLCDDGLFPGPLIVAFSNAAKVLESGPATRLQQLVEVLSAASEFGAAHKPTRPRHFILFETVDGGPLALKRWRAAGADFAQPRRGQA